MKIGKKQNAMSQCKDHNCLDANTLGLVTFTFTLILYYDSASATRFWTSTAAMSRLRDQSNTTLIVLVPVLVLLESM